MTKREVLSALRVGWAEWEAALTEVDPAAMEIPAINAGWTIKDTIAHVNYYERWLLVWLEAAVRGKVTYATHVDLLDVDARNALVFAENRDRPLGDVLAESRQVHERLVQLVAAMPEADLIEPHRFERYVVPIWNRSQPVWRCIAGETYEHYPDHIRSIREWWTRRAEPVPTGA